MVRESTRRAIGIASALGLILRLAWWWHAQPDPVSDFEYARRLAEGLLDHHQYGYPRVDGGRVPAYPVLLAALMLISRSTLWLSFANALLSAMLVPLVARLARALELGPTVEAGAAFACALNPTFVFFAPVLATEHLFVVLLVWALIEVLRWRTTVRSALRGDNDLRMGLAGALFGAAVLARADALFYLPVVAGLAWVAVPRPRSRGPAAFLLCAAIVVAPWYIRNRLVVGPGAGLSTASGPNFYYAHNVRAYGWHALQGTPLEGLDQLQMQERGYALGFEYLSQSSVRRIAGDILTGTERLYAPSDYSYALHWSTRRAGRTPDEFSAKPVTGTETFEWLSGAYRILLYGALLSLVFVRRYPPVASFTLYGIVVMNWIGHSWIFWGDPRFRYVAEVAFCLLAAMAIASVARTELWSALGRPTTSRSGLPAH